MTPLVQNVTDFLSYLTVLADIFVVALAIILVTPLKKHGWGKGIKDFFGEYSIPLCFLVGLGSVAGSLFYSNVAGFAPCFLCWIQRAFLYTEAVVLFFALFARKEEHVQKYGNFVRNTILTLSTIGGLVSIYNVYLQFGGGSAINCAAFGTVSCELVYFVEYGYITIPTMALTAFALTIVFMLCRKKSS